jgi:hypothetical protein
MEVKTGNASRSILTIAPTFNVCIDGKRCSILK